MPEYLNLPPLFRSCHDQEHYRQTNKIISQGRQCWKTINVEGHLSLFGRTENRAELFHEMNQTGVLTKSGAFDIELGRRNLGGNTDR